MIRALLQVLLLPDRTRVFEHLLGRFRHFGYAAILLYGTVVAIIGSAQYAKYDEPDGLWPLFFVLTAGTYALMIRSPLDAWRLATVAIVAEHALMDYNGGNVTPWQWCTYIPVGVAVAVFYSRGVVVYATLITMLVLASVNVESGTPAFAALGVALLIYTFGARGRAEQRVEQERAEKGALVERARIAREMHDVVAHHMSLVAVRCETAPYRIDGLSAAATREFAELGDAARAAISDMQGLLGVLRTNGQAAELEPQPGIAEISELAKGAVVDVPADVSEAVGLTAYRIVQEALTNAARHAPGSEVSVHVRRQGADLEVLVRNTAGGASLGGGGGHGLAGMRERVAVYGGSLVTESTEDGGFVVRALIPLGEK